MGASEPISGSQSSMDASAAAKTKPTHDQIRRAFAKKPLPPLPVKASTVTSSQPAGSGPFPEGDVAAQKMGGKASAAAMLKALTNTSASLVGPDQAHMGSHVVDRKPLERPATDKTKSTAVPALDTARSGPLEGAEGNKAVPLHSRVGLECVFRSSSGKAYGKDVAVPLGKRGDSIASLQATKADAERRLADPSEDKLRLHRRMDQCDKAIAWLEGKGEYCATGDVRGAVNKGADPQDLQSAEMNNFWKESFVSRSGEKVGSLLRFGAMTDRTGGLINYRALKIISLCELKERIAKGERLSGNEIKKYQDDAKRTLEAEKSKIESLREKLKEEKKLTPAREKALSEALEVLDCTPGVEESPVQKALEKRQILLQEQMCQLLSSQIHDHGAEVGENERLHLFQVSLLNHNVRGVDKNGLPHCEDNEMLDEAELFTELDGKKVMLDATSAPYVDSNGVYHVKRPDSMKEERQSIEIATHFSNVVVQRSLKGQEAREQYREVNRDSLQAMKIYLEAEKKHTDRELEAKGTTRQEVVLMLEKVKKCEKAINQGKVDFQIAEDLSQVGLFLGWNLSLNCHSGKDRTGYIAFRIIHERLCKEIDKDETLSPKEKVKLRHSLAGMVYSPKGIARMIASVNGALHLKLNPIKAKAGTVESKIKGILEGFMALVQLRQGARE